MRTGIKKTRMMTAMAAALLMTAALAVPAHAENFTAAQKTMYVTADSLNVRTAPDTGAAAAGTLSRGETVEVTGTGSEWVQIARNGQQYYVAARYLSDSAPAAAAPAASQPAVSVSLPAGVTETAVSLSSDMTYAGFSKINSGSARLYKNENGAHGNITVCVNAGHGTSGGERVKTQSHPDGTGKVTGGTNAAGAVTSMAASSGMDFADGTPEGRVTLREAQILRQKLLERGYSVLMIREETDVQLDNIARTVLANTYANCHVAIHWDSSTSDKGAFYMSVPDALKNMEPVKSDWQQSEAFGESLIAGLRNRGVKIFSGGSMDMDLTQTSYSTVPSVDLELGDKVSDHSDAALDRLAEGIADGIDLYFLK